MVNPRLENDRFVAIGKSSYWESDPQSNNCWEEAVQENLRK